jgi:RNHCP domain-containing protein
MKARSASFGDFRCAHCDTIVSSTHLLSGVNNRNHCPYCLWSRHLDLFVAGDRLSACKAPMKPIGLTMKKGRNKYQREPRGELMLIHACVECQALSINRIAADDDSDNVMTVFEKSFTLAHPIHALCQENGIVILNAEDAEVVRTQLYGRYAEIPVLSWT